MNYMLLITIIILYSTKLNITKKKKKLNKAKQYKRTYVRKNDSSCSSVLSYLSKFILQGKVTVNIIEYIFSEFFCKPHKHMKSFYFLFFKIKISDPGKYMVLQFAFFFFT